MVEFIVKNWYYLIILLAIIVVGVYLAVAFFKMPTNAQIAKVKEWLLYAVAKAEKELGGGTGKLKLRYVYDMFIAKFPYLVQVISFESFSDLVDEVLDKFKDILSANKAVQMYIESEVNKNES